MSKWEEYSLSLVRLFNYVEIDGKRAIEGMWLVLDIDRGGVEVHIHVSL